MGRKPGDSSDRIFLVVVMEFSESTAGRALDALQAEELTALRLPHPTHLKLATDQLRPRVFVVDADVPGAAEFDAIRTMRAKERSGSLIVLLLGTAAEKALAPDLCEMVDAYMRKPFEWSKVARTVMQMANNRPPPGGVVLLR